MSGPMFYKEDDDVVFLAKAIAFILDKENLEGSFDSEGLYPKDPDAPLTAWGRLEEIIYR